MLTCIVAAGWDSIHGKVIETGKASLGVLEIVKSVQTRLSSLDFWILFDTHIAKVLILVP
jgi:hypothetical protein